MINSQIKEKIKKEAVKFFKGVDGSHDWTHVERVTKLALVIGEQEKANLDVLELASLLHDIGRKEEIDSKGKICHAQKGFELAKRVLQKYDICKKDIDNILHCILTHRFKNKHVPQTIEAKVLFDADKLDSIGAIGIARDFLFTGNAGSNNLYTGKEKKLSKEIKNYSYSKEDSAILEYEITLKKIKNKMLTRIGKNMAKERHKFMKQYFDRFWKEVEGKL